jgi:type IV pilus assembly protein PilX
MRPDLVTTAAFRTARMQSQLPRRERGAALVIGLIMLLILTILAFTGVNTATTELAMASNEQFRRNAAEASAAGVEESIASLGLVGTTAGATATLPEAALGDDDVTTYASITRYVGDETNLPQSSADKFIGLHYEIESTGTSARNARDVQTQGVMVITATGGGGDETLTSIGGGLE